MFKLILLSVVLAFATAFTPSGRFVSRTQLQMNVMPPPPKDTKSGKNIAETAMGTGTHKTLIAALEACKLTSVFTGADKFTVFAPTDAAFAKLPAGTVDALLKDIPKLTNILKYHVSAFADNGNQRPTRNGRSFDTLCANEANDGTVKETGVLVTVDTCESYMLSGNDNAKIVASVECTNGWIHVLDTVMLPYAGKSPSFGPGSEKKDPGLLLFNREPGESGEQRYGGGGGGQKF